MVPAQQAQGVDRIQEHRHAIRARSLPEDVVSVRPFLDPLLVFPDPPPPELAQTLDLAGYPWKAASSPDTAARLEPPDGWTRAVVPPDRAPEGGWSFCRTVRKRDVPLAPLLLLVSG